MSILHGLNDPQRRAVTTGPGPTLVLAGPGSGKTRVLTHRIAYLIGDMGIPPWHIMAVTFTNKAAREMGERVEALAGERPRGIAMGTFHATCARLLRRESDNLIGYSDSFVIFDTDDQKQVVKQALADLNLDDKRFPPPKLLGGISSAKNELITPDIYAAGNYISEINRRVYTRYQEILVANDAMDFDDLLLNAVLLLDERPDLLQKYQERYRHVLVDEFQDTNTAQYALLTRLAGGHRNIFAVGDADQSIYKWRGADFRNINRFRQEFPDAELILLEQNYRSTQVILDAAKAVIRRNSDRVDKDLFTERSGGARIEIEEAYNETEEAHTIVATIQRLMRGAGYDNGDFAVMYRTNAQSRALEEAFLREQLPYALVGGTRFYSRREIKDLIAYLRLVHNPSDSVSFARIGNTPTRGIGKKTEQQLRDWALRQGMQPGVAVMKLGTDPDVQHPFKSRAFNALAQLGRMLDAWVQLSRQATVSDLLDIIIQQIGYRQFLEDQRDPRYDNDRWDNVQELLGVAQIDPDMTLADFLEQVALVADVDELEAGQQATTLLTLHAAKGLEFPVVFITGLEEGVLPHSRSLDDGEELAEERRLFYVGLTRAKDRVYLSYAFRRTVWGQSDTSTPSRFLGDLPSELVNGGTAGARHQQAVSRASDWHWPTSGGGSGGSASRSGGYAESPRVTRRTRRASDSGRVPSPLTSRPTPAPTADKGSANTPTRGVTRYRTGQKVRHGKFGDGIVIESQSTGADEEVTVAFSDVGIKRLAASFANLTSLDDL